MRQFSDERAETKHTSEGTKNHNSGHRPPDPPRPRRSFSEEIQDLKETYQKEVIFEMRMYKQIKLKNQFPCNTHKSDHVSKNREPQKTEFLIDKPQRIKAWGKERLSYPGSRRAPASVPHLCRSRLNWFEGNS